MACGNKGVTLLAQSTYESAPTCVVKVNGQVVKGIRPLTVNVMVNVSGQRMSGVVSG